MRRSRMTAGLIAWLVSVAPAAHAQSGDGQIAMPARGQTLAFDVASVKPSAPDERLRVFNFRPTGFLVARNQTLRLLIAMAYGTPFPIPLPDDRIVGGPEWMATARFVVEARSDQPPAPATAARDIAFMLRTLLADRFKLAVRIERRPQRVYALTRAPRARTEGLRRSTVDCLKERCGVGGPPGRLELHGAGLDLLAMQLSETVGRPVIDRTGLSGTFDGVLEWTPSPDEVDAIFGPEAASDARHAEPGLSLFTAVQEQLGLRLRDERAPIETIVVTHAEPPTEN